MNYILFISLGILALLICIKFIIRANKLQRSFIFTAPYIISVLNTENENIEFDGRFLLLISKSPREFEKLCEDYFGILQKHAINARFDSEFSVYPKILLEFNRADNYDLDSFFKKYTNNVYYEYFRNKAIYRCK